MNVEEITEFKRRVAKAKADPVNISVAEKLQDAYREGKIVELAKHKSITREEAGKLIPRQTATDLEKKEHFLPHNEIVEIGGDTITIQELKERGNELDNLSMPDPIEGSAYGTSTAKFFYNDGISPCIRSHAHGLQIIYRLEHPSGFSPCEFTVVHPDEKQQHTDEKPDHPPAKHSLRGKSADLKQQALDQRPVLGMLALMGQSTVFYAAPNTGKTLLVIWLLIERIKSGNLDPSNIYYINVDDSLSGLQVKLELAEKYGFHMLAEGYENFTADAFLTILFDLISKDQASGVIIILDTLKKFTDLMDKRRSSRFTKVIRAFILKGGTIIALAHTNKNPGSDGKPKYAGTTDILDDFDCAFTLGSICTTEEPIKKVVTFENIKRRGNVTRSVSYSYSDADGLTYNTLFDSVTPIEDAALTSIKRVEELRSDASFINAITASIKEGITTKMKLTDAAADRSGISKRAALRLIDKYTGTDPAVHNWTYMVGDRGAKVYSIVEGTGND